MTEFFHLFQAQAFLDYSSKFTLKDKEQFMSLFDAWAESKEFSPEDRIKILKFVEDLYSAKTQETEVKENKKPRKKRKEIPQNINDPRQIEFDF